MRHNLVSAVALAAAVLVSGSAFAGDFGNFSGHGPSFDEREKAQQNYQNEVTYGYPGSASTYSRPESFTVVRLGELSKGASARVKAKATTESVEALQASILSDAALASELREHGVQIKNIIGAETALNGRTIYYLR
jgi:hypothetical protein